MKNLYFLFILIILCSCNNDELNSVLKDENVVNNKLVTRAADSTANYYFDFADSSISNLKYDFQGEILFGPSECYISSYVDIGEQTTDLAPEVVDKPSWVSLDCRHVYYKIFVVIPTVNENTSNIERTGTIVLRQPGSNKTLSIPLTQGISNNIITINVATIFKNRYQFTATASYPIKGNNLTVDIPFVVYNDGGEMNETARIVFNKGDITSYSIMDYNPAPLVYYHGDLKGYRLSTGKIYSQSDDYNYSFNRYW